ncbi:MAG: hypothetical protein K2Y42_06510 [Hyphomicrobium sp.]|jgi:hypothetical protein|uniref:hypothetical protein n=1 Tax=Hyphomicrobium sp. TaxID=82 RepID=UPI0025C13A55|nr:hypothetical protein [Hyphomicrobium sp.]MBX9862390.1 hypothetical protein [Hyphomicrobium sp.]
MPRSSKAIYETLIWRGITCRVCTTRDHRIDGWTVITLRAPEDVPFPLGVRGYCRHGLEQAKLDAEGGTVAYFRAWADRDSNNPAYLNAVAGHRQGDLFRR